MVCLPCLIIVLIIFRAALVSAALTKSSSSSADRVKLLKALQKQGTHDIVETCFRFLDELTDVGILHWSEILKVINQVIVPY